MTFSLTHEVLRIAFRDPFRIARALDPDESHGMTTVIVGLASDRAPGIAALGEGYPDAYYGETEGTMAAVLPRLLAAVAPFEDRLAGPDATLEDGRSALVEAAAAMDAALRHNGAAKCALDIALHDLLGQRLGLPVHALLGLSADIPPTDFTIGIDETAMVAQRAARAAHFPRSRSSSAGRATSTRSPRSGPSTMGRSGSTPTRAGRSTGRGTPAARPGPPRRRAHRAALPGAPAGPAGGPPGGVTAADRGR